MAESWWATELEPQLSQGDLIAELVFSLAVFPLAPLEKESVRGKPAWVAGDWKPDQAGRAEVLAAGRRTSGIILTHSCELDKPKARGRVQVAPVLPLSSLPLEQQLKVVAQQVWSKLPLPASPGLGDAYADLHLSMPFDRRQIDANAKVGSLTKAARQRLKLQLIAFYTRLDASGHTLPDEDAEHPR